MKRVGPALLGLCVAAAAVTPGAAPARGASRVLRVCADPNNLPFSDLHEHGFENRLAGLIAAELGARVQYTWWPQRRGFVRNTLRAGSCDAIMGVPANYELVRTTAAYYRSSYVFVTRRDRGLSLRSLDDPRLHTLKLGVHVIGDDYAGVPPIHALARRGIVQNVTGYSIYGDYRTESPPAALIRAVAAGEIDAALAWGPLAGYHARRSALPLEVTPIEPQHDGPVPLVFDIAVGVRKDDAALAAEIDRVLARRGSAVHALLRRYGVPQL